MYIAFCPGPGGPLFLLLLLVLLAAPLAVAVALLVLMIRFFDRRKGRASVPLLSENEMDVLVSDGRSL